MDDLQTRLREFVALDEPAMGLTSQTLLAAARRSQRRRRGAGILGGAMLMLALTLAVTAALTKLAEPQQAPAPQVAGPARVSLPYGQTAEAIDAAVRAYVPDGGALVTEKVYPSDWTRDTALPIELADQATDWHGFWRLPNRQLLRVSLMYLPHPDSGATPCADLDTSCEVTRAPDGSLLVSYVLVSDGGEQTLWVRNYRSSTFQVLVGIRTDDNQFAYTRAQLGELATDPALSFDKPAVLPTGTPLP
jgi:hypothetical protein